jgi:hypothetical protein
VGCADRAERGKSASTAHQLAQYSAQVEGDFWLYYRIDVRDLYRKGGGASRMTHRLLGVLIERLPPESATKTAMRDSLTPEQLAAQAEAAKTAGVDAKLGPYSNTDMHLGQLIDEIRWLRFAVYHSQGGKPKKPNPYPRPGVPSQQRALSPKARAYLTKIKNERTAIAPPPAVVPAHIGQAAHKKLGPSEKAWIAQQLAAMDRQPAT